MTTTLSAPTDRVEQIERKVLQLSARVDALDDRPTDIAKIRFTPSVVAVILTTALSVAGGIWASTSGLRSDVRDILTRMDVSAKLVDERATALQEAVGAVQRRQELQQYQIQELNVAIQRLSASSQSR